MAIATAVRRYKSERNLALGTPLTRLQLAPVDDDGAEPDDLTGWLEQARADLMSITRAGEIEIRTRLDPERETIQLNDRIRVQIEA